MLWVCRACLECYIVSAYILSLSVQSYADYKVGVNEAGKYRVAGRVDPGQSSLRPLGTGMGGVTLSWSTHPHV